MNILHVITRLIRGGAQQNTVLTCRAQVRAGHRVWLAYGPIYGPEGSLMEEARQAGAVLCELPFMRRALLPVHDVLVYRSIVKLIGQIRPDVVQTHSSKAGIVGRLAAWRCRIRVVVHTVHGLAFHEHQNLLVNHLYINAERLAARRCHRIIGVSRAMVQQMARCRIGRPEQFTVIHNAFDLDEYDRLIAASPAPAQVRSRWGIPAQGPLIGVVARLDRLKGQDDLLDVLPQLRRSTPDLRVVFVGDGWYRDHLQTRVAAAGLQHEVIFTGLVPLGDLVSLLRAMDVMVLPSYREGLPRTMVESLLCGCAIVGYDCDGIGEICLDRQTGRLVTTGDLAALAQAITWLLDHPLERGQMVRSGRQLVREQFELNAVVRQTQLLYEQVRGEQPDHG